MQAAACGRARASLATRFPLSPRIVARPGALASTHQRLSARSSISDRNVLGGPPARGPARAAPAAPRAVSTAGRVPPALPHHLFSDSLWGRLLGRLARAGALLALAATIIVALAAPAHAARSGARLGGGAGFAARAAAAEPASGYGAGHPSAVRHSAHAAAALAPLGARGRAAAGAARALAPAGGAALRSYGFFFSPFGMGMGGYGGGGGGLGSLFFTAVFLLIAVQAAQSFLGGRGGGGPAGAASALPEAGDTTDAVTVAKLQVGLLASAAELRADLERLAGRADTASPAGLHRLLQETVLALLRNPDYAVYAYAKAGVEASAGAGETRFNRLSLEERGKFEQETLVNAGGVTRRAALKRAPAGAPEPGELVVVTLLVAAAGRFRLPRGTSRTELAEALATLGSVRAADVLAVEVLWTPEAEGDFFSVDDLATDYPLLNTI
jgi:uncharacterized membrane protein